jgi:hypothetical protein
MWAIGLIHSSSSILPGEHTGIQRIGGWMFPTANLCSESAGRRVRSPSVYLLRAGLKYFHFLHKVYSEVVNEGVEEEKNTAFWVVTPCGSCMNRRFGRTLVFTRGPRRNIQEDGILSSHHRVNIRS